MAFYFSGNTVDQNDVPVVGAKVYVYAGGVLANLIDADGDELANPLTTVAGGFYEGWTNDRGELKAVFYWGGKERRVREISRSAEVEAFAATALAAAGPNYASTAAGLAATTEGDTFAVDEGDTIAVYAHDAGPVATFLRRFPQDIAAGGGSDLVGFTQSGTGAATRTVQAKLREVVSPEDFSGTDTEKFNAALATGKSVRCSATSYAITGTLEPTASGQIIDLNGALLTCTGNFNVFTIDGGIQGVRIGGGRIEAAAMTGGYVFSISNADRLTLENMVVLNPFNFAFIEQANVVQIGNVWVNNIRGSYGIRWLGDNTKRSDILRLVGLNMSFPDSGTGIEWDGNCHTLQTIGVTIVRPNKGVRVLNTAGGTFPAFGFFTGLEIDFPVSYGVELLAGEDYYFGPQFYCHDSQTASGVYVGPSISTNRVTFLGGKITDHATYGIENNVRVLVSNLVMDNNTTADFLDSDDAYLTVPRIEVDDTFLMRRDSSGNPVFQFDATDFMGFNRAANDLFTQIGGVTRFQISADNNAVRLMVGGALVQVTAGANDSGGTGFRALRVPNS